MTFTSFVFINLIVHAPKHTSTLSLATFVEAHAGPKRHTTHASRPAGPDVPPRVTYRASATKGARQQRSSRFMSLANRHFSRWCNFLFAPLPRGRRRARGCPFVFCVIKSALTSPFRSFGAAPLEL
ncbi:hypothetical protein EVAR_89348_1 [Eumeta japonica]|uniref:Uncharacterized protein n=1 Tax=Eumeta variegata TaxID=151549 RepID=A0A4C1Y4D2_EUMVA|nr:hypothetical protein EVAR_89348_1 [Eumeta japonica]